MENKGRFQLLIYICVFVLVALVSIQFYLLRNTFQLNKANYNGQVQAAVLKLDNDSEYQGLQRQYLTNLISCSKMLLERKIDQRQFVRMLTQKDKLVINKLDSFINLKSQKTPILHHVRLRTGYAFIHIADGAKVIANFEFPNQRDTLMKLSRKGCSVLSLGQNSGSTDHVGTNALNIRYRNLIYLEIPTLPHFIIQQLALVGGLSLVLLVAVVMVFYRVIRSAQRQKKLTELREDLVNNITHELKTPLSSMAIAFKTLKLDVYQQNGEKQAELINSLERQHHKLNTTVERVLESAANPEKTLVQEIDIAGLLKTYQSNLFLEAHQLEVNVIQDTIYVKGSRGLIEAAVDNLLENAQKYSPDGSLIQIMGTKESEYFRVDVIDSGTGIDKNYQEYLFEKFFRVPQQNLHTVQGLGLGLYLSRKAILKIGGTLELTSSSTQGSVFTLKLPLA